MVAMKETNISNNVFFSFIKKTASIIITVPVIKNNKQNHIVTNVANIGISLNLQNLLCR